MATGITQSGFNIQSGGTYNGTAAPAKQTLASNYIDFTSNTTKGWFQQYLPDLIEKEAEVFGNRTIGGFLEMVGAEEGAASDQVVWSEQGRLHLKYEGAAKGNFNSSAADYHADNAIIDGLGTDHAIRVGDTVLVSSAAKNKTLPCLVTAIDGDEDASNVGGAITLGSGEIAVVPIGVDKCYKEALGHANGAGDNDPLVLVVYGSAFAKGKTGREEAVQPEFKSRTNTMMIMKDLYEVSGSDTSQIGWVEVSGEDGQNGYMWYLKAAGDTRVRFTDYCEMAMIESVKALNTTVTGANIAGTEGLFAAIEDRGIISADLDTVSASSNLDEFDLILKEFDKQGAIEEYMMFLDRDTALLIDDMLAGLNPHSTGGLSFGVFDNDEDMALNLGFSGFRRGSYDFYKSDWKYLNDIQTRGALTGDAARKRGVMIPAGVSSVYDQVLGKNLKRPFLHVRYRASNMDDRRFKTWTTGSVGAATSDLDAMQMHFLTERCLVVQGANNFCLLQD
jgi:hypothetical protein